MSYKVTGSTGFGYEIAKKFDIKIKNIYPIGVGLHYKIPKELQGVTLDDVLVKVYVNKKEIYAESGSIMFTHYGIGGPVIRRISGYVTKSLQNKESVRLKISFLIMIM